MKNDPLIQDNLPPRKGDYVEAKWLGSSYFGWFISAKGLRLGSDDALIELDQEIPAQKGLGHDASMVWVGTKYKRRNRYHYFFLWVQDENMRVISRKPIGRRINPKTTYSHGKRKKGSVKVGKVWITPIEPPKE